MRSESWAGISEDCEHGRGLHGGPIAHLGRSLEVGIAFLLPASFPKLKFQFGEGI